MARYFTDSYQKKAIDGMMSVTGKYNWKQPVRSRKDSRKQLVDKLIKYIARAGWKA